MTVYHGGAIAIPVPNLQMCFRTAAALKTLTFVGGEEP